MKITILDDYQHIIHKLDCFEMLSGQEVQILHETEKDPVKLATRIKDTEILVLTRERTKISEELLKNLPRLKLISQTGKKSRHIDLEACSKYRVALAEGVGSPVATGELTWALLMNTVRQIPQAIEGMKAGKWQVNIGQTVSGKTIGIWGYGRIGKIMAQYAKVFGAKVLVWGSDHSRNQAVADGFDRAPSKAYFFEHSDIVSLHLRLNDETKAIVTEADLFRMKENACLINTARAELIEAEVLFKVLDSGKQIFVGVDVYEEEPVYDTNYSLLKRSNVVCTPHLGYVEKNGYELYFAKAFENALNFIDGKPTGIANEEVLN